MGRPAGVSSYDPEAIAFAVAAVKAGRSYRDVAEELAELGVQCSHMTVKRWCAAAPKAAEAVRQAAPPIENSGAAAPAPAATAEEPFDFEASLHAMIRQAEIEARTHDQASNPRGAQAAMRRAAELMKVLSQTEKRKPADPNLLTFSRAEIDKAIADLTVRLEAMCSRGLLCADCSRKLSVRFGRGQ